MTDREAPRPVALVTGGTRGIGLGIARSLAASGWDLAISGLRSPNDVAAAVDMLKSSGAGVEYCAADIGVADDRARLVDTTLARFGRVNVLVNNAGRAPRTRADLLVTREESFEEVMRTNLQGPFFLTQRVAGLLIQTREADPAAPAAIVFITSVSAAMVSVSRGEYCVSKAGLGMTASLFAVRLAEHRVPVYEVRPGIIETDMTSAVKELYDRRIADGLVPDRRWGTPDDVGRVVAALARGDLPYATGSVIHVDGGLAIPRL